ncbi:MAG: transposase [Gemmataceae bacterium]
MKTTEQGGPKGYDGGKRVVGRKRHLVVDTLGLVWAVVVTPASVQDWDGGREAMLRGPARRPPAGPGVRRLGLPDVFDLGGLVRPGGAVGGGQAGRAGADDPAEAAGWWSGRSAGSAGGGG